jgi:hypothetical protein
MHRAIELTSPAEKAVIDEVRNSGSYDLVVANDARALPLAFAVAGSAPVLADMHEWAAEEQSRILAWRVLISPYMEHLCASFLPRTNAVTTVSQGLAKLYGQQYGTLAQVVRNAPEFQDIDPSVVDPKQIRLVHSGIADAERNIVGLIDAVHQLGQGFSLDLYLVDVPGGYLDLIRKKIANLPRITLHDPVPPETLPRILNRYDLGVFLYPISTLSHLHHLPNKFFDFVQARLGLVFSSAPEVDDYIQRFGLGLITQDWTADALVHALQNITADQIRRYKRSSHDAARALSYEPDRAVLKELVGNLLVLNT